MLGVLLSASLWAAGSHAAWSMGGVDDNCALVAQRVLAARPGAQIYVVQLCPGRNARCSHAIACEGDRCVDNGRFSGTRHYRTFARPRGALPARCQGRICWW